jgi:acetyl-CoA C-acetyltransferase
MAHVESMSRVQIALGQNLSDWLRRMFQASAAQRIGLLRKLRPTDIRLFVPEVKNRVTGRSMGEHTEDMAKTWNIGRHEQDELALQGHQRVVAAQDRDFFADLIVPVDYAPPSTRLTSPISSTSTRRRYASIFAKS